MRRSRFLPSALISLLLITLAACGDPLRITASEPVIMTQMQVYPFSRVPPTYPAAVNTAFAAPVPVTASGSFDIAFDMDDQGRIVVLTAAAVVTPLTGVRRVGLLHAGASYEAVTSAPTGPFTYDSLLTIVPGEVVVIESHRGSAGDVCGFAISPFIYSKLRIVSVNPDTHALLLDFVTDPNCGFRSFEEGIPRT